MADFEAVLRLDSANIDALCGRGHARVRLRQVAAGVQDAEEALRRGLRKPPQLFSLACLYAQAALQTRVAQRGTLAKCGDQFLYQDRAIDLLIAVMEATPEPQRKAFWQANVANERELVPLRIMPKMQELVRRYGGAPAS